MIEPVHSFSQPAGRRAAGLTTLRSRRTHRRAAVQPRARRLSIAGRRETRHDLPQRSVRSEAGRAARPGRARRRGRRGREGVRRRGRPRRADRAEARRTSATGRRCRWPAARSARCRRPPSPTPASGSTRPAPRSRPPSTPGWPSSSRARAPRVLVEEAVDVTLPCGPAPARRPAPADHADGAHRRPVRRDGLRDRRRARGRARVVQLRRAQHRGRPPGARADGHLLRGRGDGDPTPGWCCAPTPRRYRPARC